MTFPRTNDPAEFAEQITGLVHDDFLDVDEIDFDRTLGELRIPLRAKAPGPPEKILVVTTVKEIEIRDTEHIGWYDINTIRIDLMRNCIKIRCGIPLQIDVLVTDPFGMCVVPLKASGE